MAEQLRAQVKATRLTLAFGTVTIELECENPYFAAVLYEDLEARLKAGESIVIRVPLKSVGEKPK